MRLRHIAFTVAISFASLPAFADSLSQLSSSSQLSAGDSTITFPSVTTPTPVTGPQTYTVGNNTATFTNSGNRFEEDTVGFTYQNSGFAKGTNILYSQGFSGPSGPVTVTFANAVSEFGFNAEEYATGNELFTLAVFDGTSNIGTFTSTGNDPKSLAFLGARATSGGITSFTLSDTTGNNIALGPVSFQTAVTPEPSSLALLGTGVMGVIGAVRRRLMS